jgi:hypothetical protein
VYHVEFRQFPHNLCCFNLNDEELRAIVEPWVRGEWVELEERKWSPHQARLTILEGPELPLDRLSMGRGWRYAQRQSKDVTKRLLAQAKESASSATQASPQDPSPDRQNLGDSLALELLSRLADAPAPLSQAWRLASARYPDRSAPECLTLAEQAIRSLLHSRLIVLLHPAARTADSVAGAGSAGGELGEQETERVLREVDSWTGEGESAGVRMHRA